MRNTIGFIILILVVGMMTTCSPKKEASDHPKTGVIKSESERMEAFHLLMAETFHPFKDSGNLTPIKIHADEMAIAAEQWASEPLPEKIANENTKLKLEQLKIETQSLAKLVKTGTDAEIGMALEKLHELFHELRSIWSSEPEGEHEHR